MASILLDLLTTKNFTETYTENMISTARFHLEYKEAETRLLLVDISFTRLYLWCARFQEFARD